MPSKFSVLKNDACERAIGLGALIPRVKLFSSHRWMLPFGAYSVYLCMASGILRSVNFERYNNELIVKTSPALFDNHYFQIVF